MGMARELEITVTVNGAPKAQEALERINDAVKHPLIIDLKGALISDSPRFQRLIDEFLRFIREREIKPRVH